MSEGRMVQDGQEGIVIGTVWRRCVRIRQRERVSEREKESENESEKNKVDRG